MKTNRKVAAVLAVLGIAAALCGCKLAKEDAAEAQEQDRLIGVFITPNSLMTDDKLYAVQTGDETRSRYSFGAEGYAMMGPRMSEGTDAYIAFAADEGVSDVRFVGGGNTEIYGTVYTMPVGFIAYYLNPVYQEADGDVYALSGQGISASYDTPHVQSSMTHTIDETYTQTTDGETESVTTKVVVAMVTRQAPDGYEIVYMDANDTALAREPLYTSYVPDCVTPVPNTEYIVLIEHTKDESGAKTTTRTLCDRSEDYIEVFAPLDEQVIAKHSVEVKW